MNEKEAYEILSKELGPDFYIVGCYKKFEDIFLFSVKGTKYKDDSFVLPTCYGVDGSGKVLDWDALDKIYDERGIE